MGHESALPPKIEDAVSLLAELGAPRTYALRLVYCPAGLSYRGGLRSARGAPPKRLAIQRWLRSDRLRAGWTGVRGAPAIRPQELLGANVGPPTSIPEPSGTEGFTTPVPGSPCVSGAPLDTMAPGQRNGALIYSPLEWTIRLKLVRCRGLAVPVSARARRGRPLVRPPSSSALPPRP